MSGRGIKRKGNNNDGPPNKKPNNFIRNAKREPQIFLKKNFIHRQLLNFEFACLFQYCTLGGGSQKPTWCALRNFTGVMSSILLRIECPDEVVDSAKEYFSFLEDFHQDSNLSIGIETTTREDFFNSLFKITQSNKAMIRKYIEEVGEPFALPECSENAVVRPCHFVCTMSKMAEYGFPMAYGDKIVPTKENYKMVTSSSPVYVLDCEMCRNKMDVPVVTRVSLIDERGKIVFDTLVMPDEPIGDYCTQWSGITAESLEGVKTTLKDVQNALINILPEDAIICGHSLHFDLIALKMAHPFCLDTSLLFNITGNENHHTSLKNLTAAFLGKNIQGSKRGHCSVEDCMATLHLLNLKLTHGFNYGNVRLGFNMAKLDKPKEKENGEESSSDDEEVEPPKLQPKLCSSCGDKFAMTCPALECSCLQDSPKYCVNCLTKSAEPIPPPESTTHFNFREALQGASKWQTSLLVDCLDTPMNTIMCAIKNPKYFISNPNKNCKLIDVNDFDEVSSMIKDVGSQCAAHRFSVIECDLFNPEKYNDFDATMSEFINLSVMKNALCAFVFTSKNRTVAYVKVKDSLSVC